LLKLRFQTSLVGVVLRPVLLDAICGLKSRVFEDQTDNVSNLGHTGVVFTCCRLPFAGPRAQGGVNFGSSPSQNNGGIVFGK